jgi:hypothetical protein
MSLLGFELRQALDRSDTATADGRVRAFEEVRRIMDRAVSLKEREEEIPIVADQLRLSPESIAVLLRGSTGGTRTRSTSGSSAGRGRPPGMAERLLGNETVIEREFLVAAACHPGRAAPMLQALTPEHFSDPSNREVFVGLREAFAALADSDDGGVALDGLKVRAHGDSEAGRLFVRLVMEADQNRYSGAVLDEFHLRLQEQYLSRTISALRSRLDQGDDVQEQQRRLFHLERLLQSVKGNLTNLDPEEGRP